MIGGAMFIMLGNAMLAFGITQVFFTGLASIALGVGLLKPNVSALVANLYPEGGSRRDAGFSLFYMGINVGALLGALLVPLCAARFGWHSGFALPAAGMLIGLTQFVLTRRYLSAVDLGVPVNARLSAWIPVIVFALAALGAVALVASGTLSIDAPAVARASSWLIGSLAAGYFVYLIFFAGLNAAERRRAYVMLALFIASTVYYAGVEQTGTSLTLFADRYTDRDLFGWVMPAGILQGVSSIVVILFAPLFSALWIGLGRRGRDPSTPVKFAAGLMLMGLGFLVMYVALDAGDRGPSGAADLARALLPGADVGRSVSGAGRALLHDQARGAALRRTGHGRVVSVHRPRQQPRRAARDGIRRGQPGLAPGTVSQDLRMGRGGRRGDAGVEWAAQAAHGGSEVAVDPQPPIQPIEPENGVAEASPVLARSAP